MKTNKQKLTSGSILLLLCHELFNGRSWSTLVQWRQQHWAVSRQAVCCKKQRFAVIFSPRAPLCPHFAQEGCTTWWGDRVPRVRPVLPRISTDRESCTTSSWPYIFSSTLFQIQTPIAIYWKQICSFSWAAQAPYPKSVVPWSFSKEMIDILKNPYWTLSNHIICKGNHFPSSCRSLLDLKYLKISPSTT